MENHYETVKSPLQNKEKTLYFGLWIVTMILLFLNTILVVNSSVYFCSHWICK